MKSLNEKKEIFVIILLSILVRLVFSVKQFALTWDSAVYLGMAKYIFSLGNLGLWEPIRPVVWPFLLGIFWKSGLDAVAFGRLLEITLSIASIYLLFKICEKIFDKNIALIASFFFSFSLTFLELEFNLQTGILATFLILLSIYLFLRQKIFLAGLFAGLAFLTKFYYGVFIIILLVFMIKQVSIKNYKNLLLGFGIPLLPYLIANTFLYKNPFFPFISANYVINHVIACNFLNPQPWYYFFQRIFIENPLNIIALLGVVLLLKKPKLDRIFFLSLFVLPLAYLTTLSCKTPRYLLLILPFLLPLTALGIDFIMDKLKKNLRLLFLLIIIIFAAAYPFYILFKVPVPEENLDYYNHFKGIEPDKLVLTNNPKLALYTDNKLELLYYPLYNSSKAEYYSDDVVDKKRDYVFIDTCYGDMICKPGDLVCINATNNLMQVLKDNYETVYYANHTVCEYFIFSYKSEHSEDTGDV